ncbi:hypothetical protein [Leyella stercorea]|nr:hypothetical protein [Leyella stercorea]
MLWEFLASDIERVEGIGAVGTVLLIMSHTAFLGEADYQNEDIIR